MTNYFFDMVICVYAFKKEGIILSFASISSSLLKIAKIVMERYRNPRKSLIKIVITSIIKSTENNRDYLSSKSSDNNPTTYNFWDIELLRKYLAKKYSEDKIFIFHICDPIKLAQEIHTCFRLPGNYLTEQELVNLIKRILDSAKILCMQLQVNDDKVVKYIQMSESNILQKINSSSEITVEAVKEMNQKLNILINKANFEQNSNIGENKQSFDDTSTSSLENSSLSNDQLYVIAIEKIDGLIDTGKFESALQTIQSLLNTELYLQFPEKFTIELKQRMGIVYINKGQIEKAQIILTDLIETDIKEIAKYNFMITMAIQLGNEKTLEDGIAGLKELGENEIKINLKRLQFELQQHNYCVFRESVKYIV
ncbi:MAG: hypothetical protein JWM44_2858 [Bacilli bacterium]|nr:hypothetical protein [Bacilli bacterium]